MWFAPSKSQSTPLLPDKWEALITRSGIECVFPFFFLFIPYYRGGTIIECSEKVAVRWKFLANFGWVELSSMIIFEDSIVASSNLLRSAPAIVPWNPASTPVRASNDFFLILWGLVVWHSTFEENFCVSAAGAIISRPHVCSDEWKAPDISLTPMLFSYNRILSIRLVVFNFLHFSLWF